VQRIDRLHTQLLEIAAALLYLISKRLSYLSHARDQFNPSATCGIAIEILLVF